MVLHNNDMLLQEKVLYLSSLLFRVFIGMSHALSIKALLANSVLQLCTIRLFP